MRLLMTALDNTLYDWVTFFAKSFAAMTKELSLLLDVDEEIVLSQFKTVHQKHGNSEHPFAIFELPSVRERFGDIPKAQLLEELRRPLDAFNGVRRRELRLYDNVEETLRLLNDSGCTIVGHTEAIAANAYYRLKKLGIVKYFSHLYVLEGTYEGHPLPEREMALRPPAGLVRTIPLSERKPNPELLLDICRQEALAPGEAWYVGDSLTRDIGMAKTAGVQAVWARYGTQYDRSLWDVLVRVTHWTEEDVAREETLRKKFQRIEPDYTIDSFDELLSLAGLPALGEVMEPVKRYAAL